MLFGDMYSPWDLEIIYPQELAGCGCRCGHRGRHTLGREEQTGKEKKMHMH